METREEKEKAYFFLYVKVYQNLLYYVINFVGREDAEDIVADAFIKAWQAIENFTSLNTLKTFLYKSIKNAAINRQQQKGIRQKHNAVIARELSRQERVDSTTQRIYSNEIVRSVYEAISQLPPQSRHVLLLTIGGMDSREIAAALKMTRQNVLNIQSRSREKLRQKLTPLLEEVRKRPRSK